MITRSIPYLLAALIVLTASCTPLKSVAAPVPEPDYWPTAGWQSSMPEAQGMDSELLAQMLEEITANKTSIHSVLVIRNGYLVTEAYLHPYTRETKLDIQSVTKSVIDMLVGKAIDDGYIKGVEEKLVDYYPGREFSNPDRQKNSIRLKHLLSMSSGLDCANLSGPAMEGSPEWVQFMLDLPMIAAPGEQFVYCNGNPHLLSAILAETTGKSAREYANQTLFQPLGIPPVDEMDWGSDPQKITLGGFGLHLRPVDMARLGFLYLHQGKWDGQQIVSSHWVADSITQHIQKDDGNGYGYLWTIYPEEQDGHYAALGRAGQQIHIYPVKNLVVVVTAEFEVNTEAPEIEHMLKDFILAAIRSNAPLAENLEGVSRLQAAVEFAANPIQPVPPLPAIAREISGQLYTLEENPNGWQNMLLIFEPGADTAQVSTLGYDDIDEIGLDNIFRSATFPMDRYLMRGRWVDDQTFTIEWTMPGELLTAEIQLKYSGNNIEITIQQFVFGGEPIVIKGTK